MIDMILRYCRNINRKDLHFCPTSSWINDNIINTFLSSFITVSYNKVYFSIRFLTNITHNGTFNEVIYRFISEEQLKKSMICIPVNKNHIIILSVDSANRWTNAEIETIFHDISQVISIS